MAVVALVGALLLMAPMGAHAAGGSLTGVCDTVATTLTAVPADAGGGGQKPSITGVTISPDPADHTDTLLATPEGWYDPQGDPEGYVYQWAIWDGLAFQDIPGATDATLAPGNFLGGDLVQVTCWPFDGKFLGNAKTDTITILDLPPTCAITSPADGSNTGASIIAVTGTAFDDRALARVIVRVNGSAWWNATGLANWTTMVPIVPGANLIQARARDSAGSWGPIVGITVNGVGDLKPGVKIASPIQGSTVSDVSTMVTGTAWDDGSVVQVMMRVNGGAWFAATGTTNWSGWVTVLPGANLVEARARDNAGQWGPIAQVTFNGVADLKPVAQFTAPAQGATVNTVAVMLTGTAADDVAVTQVNVRVNGGAWVIASGTATWSTWATVQSGANLIEARARDSAGQWGPVATLGFTGASDLKPVVRFTAPADGATVATAQVMVTGTAQDDFGLDRVVMRVNGGSWFPAEGTATWSALATIVPGANLIEARAKDNAGQWGPIAVMTLNGVADLKPVVAITSPEENADVGQAVVTVTGTAVDDVAVNRVIVRVNGGAWADASGTANWTADVALAVGPNTIEARARDNAGQWGPIVTRTVTRTDINGAALTASVAAVPTRLGAELCVTLSAEASVTAEVLNIAGRTIAVVVADRQMTAGTTTLAWNGRNQAGLSVPSGTYLVRVTARGADGACVSALQTTMVSR